MRQEYERCLRCGRKLKNEDSKYIGYGKICYEKYLRGSTSVPLFEIEEVNNANIEQRNDT